MRTVVPAILLLTAACSTNTLYSRFAGPAVGTVDAVYACVQQQTKDMGYSRSQFNEKTHWYVAERPERNQVSSGLYRKTVHVLDTTVKDGEGGQATLDITAHTYDEYTNTQGTVREERKATEGVVRDARLLGQACVK